MSEGPRSDATAQDWTRRMRRGLRLVPFVVPLALAACGVGGPAYQPPGPDVAATVDMTPGLAFSPAEIRIRTGDTVAWRNQTVFAHTVTVDPRLASDPAHVSLPEGAEPFDSATVPAGQVFRHTFTVAGTYRYVCRPHESLNMLGTVIVEPGP